MKPFLALRSYLPADHPDKGKEIGSEATPADFLDTLLDVVEACARVLGPYGSLVIELGDTYAGSDTRVDSVAPDWKFPNRPNVRTAISKAGGAWPLDKSLCGIPTLFAWSLAYGRNLLRPERVTEPWRVRNLIAWCRPNPPVGALGDKFRPGTSYLTVACKARDRWFDLDAVRSGEQSAPGGSTNWHPHDGRDERGYDELGGQTNTGSHPAGAPPLDWWEIPTQPYKGAHYATFPERLVERPIKAMCPREVCTMCGEPRRRILRVDGYTDHNGVLHENGEKWSSGIAEGRGAHADKPGSRTTTTTLGWTNCDCWNTGPKARSGWDKYRRGIVLDPFCGSGTTLAVAEGLGRDSIGIDLDQRNADLARERCGMFLTVETPDREGAA